MRSADKTPSLMIFWVITVLYAVVACAVAFYIDPPKSAADWGNALAGAFSPLAFLWLLYAALAQRVELELQRRELSSNNETQKQQQEQMQRQADALSAQVVTITSEANAKYEPVLILIGGGRGHLHVRNLGAGIRDAGTTVGRFAVVETQNENITIRGELIPYFPGNTSARMVFEPEIPDFQDFTFSFTYTRIDAVRGEHVYEFLNAEQRLRLVSVSRVG